jgi:hypothetical protein
VGQQDIERLTVDFDGLRGKHDDLLDDPQTASVISRWLGSA